MVDKENALQMVHLVLETDGEEAVQLFLMRLALLVEPAGANTVRAVDLGVLIGNGKAALAIGLERVGRPDDLRIDEDAGIANGLAALLLRFLQVDDEDALRHADLDGGEADAGRGIHGVEHIGDELAQIVVHGLHRPGNLPEQRVGSLDAWASVPSSR